MRFRIAWTEPLRLQPNMTIAKTLGMKVRANVTFPPSSETLHTDCTISVDIENPDVKMLDPSFPGTESSRLSERHVCVASWGCKGGFIPGISTRIVIPNLQCNSSTTDESIFAARAVLTAVGAKPGSTIWGDYIDEISDIGVYVFHSVHITKKDSSTGDVMNALTTASTHLKTQHNEPGNSKCGGGCSYVFNTPQNATTDGIVFQDCANDKCGFAGLLGT